MRKIGAHFMMYRLSVFGAAGLCLVLKKVLEVRCMCYFKSMGGGKTTFTLFEKNRKHHMSHVVLARPAARALS